MVRITTDVNTRLKGFEDCAQLLTDVNVQEIDWVKLVAIYKSLVWQFEKDFAERKQPAIEAIKYMQEKNIADFDEIIKIINRI